MPGKRDGDALGDDYVGRSDLPTKDQHEYDTTCNKGDFIHYPGAQNCFWLLGLLCQANVFHSMLA